MLRKKLAGVLEIYDKFVGEDPYENPMRIFPAVHYSMGGLWVDFERTAEGSLMKGSPRNQATNLEGLYAAGECDYQYHGANRLGANSLLSCIYAGLVTGPAMTSYRKNVGKSAWDFPASFFERAEKHERDKHEAILKMDGEENAYVLHEELGHTMLEGCTVERSNARLTEVIAKIDELTDRAGKIGVTDTSTRANQGAQFVRHLNNMLVIARVIAQGAKNRDESRGAHFKPEFKDRDDKNWLRSTLALHHADASGPPGITYVRALDYSLCGKAIHAADEVDISLVKPRPRRYEQAGAASGARNTSHRRSASPGGRISTRRSSPSAKPTPGMSGPPRSRTRPS
jgi:succinate dehydrogenase / fumarate reductase flavoprotein subunit